MRLSNHQLKSAGWLTHHLPSHIAAGPRLMVYAVHKRWPQVLERSTADDHARWIFV